MKTYLRFKYVLVLTMLLMAWMPSARVMASNAFVASPSNEVFYDDELEAVINNLRAYARELWDISQRIAEELNQKATEEEAPELYERLTNGMEMLEYLENMIYRISSMDEVYACQAMIREIETFFMELSEDIAAFQLALIPDEAIDLGLPSGTKWAPWNVGASKPEDYGGYYAWGETEEKEVYMSYTYIPQDIGTDITGTEYDVAHVKWRGSWTMPTKEQMEELVNNCTSEWTTVNGINGCRFTGPNGNSIFLPADGLYSDGGKYDEGTSGNYWSSNSAVGYSQRSYSLSFGSDGNSIYATVTSCGLTVRPVISVSTSIAIDATNFPDENFRNWVLAQDYGQDGVLTSEEIEGTSYINVSNRRNITNLKGIEHFIPLKGLYCYYDGLTELDVSKNTALENLWCFNNQLAELDVSKNIALKELFCGENLLTILDVSKNAELTVIDCSFNQLTALDVSKNTALTKLYCCGNQIKGKAMDALIASLPESGGSLYAINGTGYEQNEMTKAQVTAAKAKGWIIYSTQNYDMGEWEEYEGSGSLEIAPVDEGEVINIGDEIDENTDLDGNVVGDIYYNISAGDGSYNAAEGCIVVTTPTDDSVIDGQDIFGEDFQAGFTGIVFKVPAGKGTIKVEAQTFGTMALKVKIGDNDPIEMELEGRLKVSFPYNVTEPTYVYIYGGTTSQSGVRRAANEPSSLKIYGIECTTTSVNGDADGDGTIDVNDITCVAAHILGRNPANFNAAAADADGDGTIDVNDITVIAGMILNAGK